MSLSSAPLADSSALMAFFALIFVSNFWRMPAFSVRWFASTCGGRRGFAGARARHAARGANFVELSCDRAWERSPAAARRRRLAHRLDGYGRRGEAGPASRRIYHEMTLRMRASFSQAVYMDLKSTQEDRIAALEASEDVLRRSRRLFGEAHPQYDVCQEDLRRARAMLALSRARVGEEEELQAKINDAFNGKGFGLPDRVQ